MDYITKWPEFPDQRTTTGQQDVLPFQCARGASDHEHIFEAGMLGEVCWQFSIKKLGRLHCTPRETESGARQKGAYDTC